MIKIGDYIYKTEEELITQFKEIIKPKYGGTKSLKFSDYTEDDFIQYAQILLWLKKNDYFIEEFPNVIQSQLDLKTFGYDKIRARIYEVKGNTEKGVSWQDRRQLIDSLTFKRRRDFPVFNITGGVKIIIRDISTNKGELHNLPLEEQLALLNNAIEYLLKKETGFESVSSEIFFGYLNNEDIKQFRKDTHIFRHGSERSLLERKTWSKKRKEFYVRLGIVIVTNIYNARTGNFPDD